MREMPTPKPLRAPIDPEEPIRLSPDQISRVRQAEAEIDAGEGVSLQELRAHFVAKRTAWMQSKNA